MLEQFQSTGKEEGREHMEGMIHVNLVLPDIHNPNTPQKVLDIDLVIVDSDITPSERMDGWAILVGRIATWDSALWKIAEVQPLGYQC